LSAFTNEEITWRRFIVTTNVGTGRSGHRTIAVAEDTSVVAELARLRRMSLPELRLSPFLRLRGSKRFELTHHPKAGQHRDAN
jgi:hypothetical protein